MEYFIGSVVTLVLVSTIMVIARRSQQEASYLPSISYSQSHVYNLIHPWMPTNHEMLVLPKSQSSKYLEKLFVKIVIVEGQAYFIRDNIFYVADMVDGDVDKDTAKQVDTMSMDAVQLNKIKTIVEKLTEGTQNDSRNSG